MDIQEFDESKFSIALSVNYVVYWLVERLSRFGKRNLELSDRFAFQDNSVAVGSAWSPAFCSSTKKKPVPQKSEPRIGCGATCRAALLLVASRQLKLLQPPIPRIPCIITSFASHFFPSHYRGSCFHNFEPSICASMAQGRGHSLETAISKLQFFYIYSLCQRRKTFSVRYLR